MVAEAARLVLAIDFGGSKVAACACSTDGQELARGVVGTTPALGAETNFTRGTDLAMRLAGRATVVAVAASTFGIPLDDGVALSPAIDGWDRLPLRLRLEDVFAAPATVATDVKVAAAAEARSGALHGSDPAIYLNLGTGLAFALVVGGAVVHGAHGAAGEIGYSLLRRPGRVGLLEEVVSGMGLARALGELDGSTAGALPAPAARTADDAQRVATLFDAARDGDVPSGRILEGFLDELCFHMVNLAVAVDPQRIAVGGGIVRAWDQIQAPLRSALDEHVPYPPEVVVGAYPFDAALRGAADLAVALARDAPAERRPGAVSHGQGTGVAKETLRIG